LAAFSQVYSENYEKEKKRVERLEKLAVFLEKWAKLEPWKV
jgi:hypothetical protein